MSQKKIIGATATLHVAEAGLTYKARIDTGALVSSLHAYNIRFLGAPPSSKMRQNIGRTIEFTTENHQGQQAKVQASIVDVPLIRSPLGVEPRYIVELAIGEGAMQRTVLASLKNRSAMTYKLLIGRNWLQGRFWVDVDQNDDPDVDGS